VNDTENAAEDQTSAAKGQLPDTDAFRLSRVAAERIAAEPPLEEGEAERIVVFKGLVTADDDIVGLVAYSIYKQHENDWLTAFRKAKGRDPNEAESSAFILGEGTARRLATYRHLAEATLAGRGPQVPAGTASAAFSQRSYAAAARYTAAGEGRVGNLPFLSNTFIYIGLAIVFVVAVLLAAHYGLPGVTGPARP
jgi:hypothetical protein